MGTRNLTMVINEKGKIETIKIANRQQANLQCERTILLSLVRRAKSSVCT